MNNELLFYLIYLKVVLARSFFRIQELDLLFFMNNELFPLLAQSFLRAQGLGLLFFTNNKLYFDLTYLKVVLARIFGSSARLLSFPIPESYSCTSRIREGQVTQQLTKKTAKKRRRTYRYSEHFGLSRIRRDRKKESPKYKTKPKQSQFKAKQSQFFGGFWRKNFNFSLKIDDTKLNFLCKTKPICSLKTE